MPTIQLFEHQTLRIGQQGFSQKHLELLSKFHEKTKTKYFSIIHKGVKFSQYVGVLRVANLSIEILPKADRHSDEKNLWRDILLQMLRTAGFVYIHTPSQAKLQSSKIPIIELFLSRFVTETEKILASGLVKKYRQRKENKNTLKGKLLINDNIKHNLVHKERFFVQYSHYSYTHLMNQILLKALNIAFQLTTNQTLKSRIAKLLFQLPDIKEKNITEKDFRNLHFNRKTAKYNTAIKLAKLIILNYSLDIGEGIYEIFALLFDMNRLWEIFIYKILKRNEQKLDFKIKFQQSKKFWQNIKLRPDLVLEKDKTKYIIDTKWKHLKDKPSIEDLRQMFVYGEYWDSSRLMLLFPKTSSQQDTDYISFNFHDREIHLKLAFINILSNNSLDKDLAKKILQKLLTHQTSPQV